MSDASDDIIQSAVQGLDIWPILALSSMVCLIIATFVSHTVASVLLVPVAAQIGEAMEVPHPNLLVMVRSICYAAVLSLTSTTTEHCPDLLGVSCKLSSCFLFLKPFPGVWAYPSLGSRESCDSSVCNS